MDQEKDAEVVFQADRSLMMGGQLSLMNKDMEEIAWKMPFPFGLTLLN